MPADFLGFAQSPVNANKVAFAFTTNPGPNADYAIYTNSTVSSVGAQKLTNTTFKNIGSIMFTPDGTKIVFTGAKPNPQDATELIYKLYVISSTTGGQLASAIDDADDAFVSPTGAVIVYTNWPIGTSSPKIKICNIDGSAKTVLTATGDNFLPQYNKTGDMISFCSSRSGQYEIWKMTSAGGSPTQVTNVNVATSDRCFGSSWSPDGTQIAFTRIALALGESGIYTVPSGGGTEDQIRAGGVQPFVFWTPTSGAAPSRSRGEWPVPGLGTSERIRQLMGLH
jgi:Tol biopolymer transport system component